MKFKFKKFDNLVKELSGAEKIIVTGASGAGKSSIARALGAVLRIPVFHLDRLFWKPGWIESSNEEYLARIAEVIAKDKFIIEGSNTSTLEFRLKDPSTVVVFVEAGASKRLFRLLKRNIMGRYKKRHDITDGCRESFSLSWLKLLKYSISYDKKRTVIEKTCAKKGVRIIYYRN